jgi:hypothetical protein
MNNDLTKSVIRIIQDFCFENSAIHLVDKFALAITTKVVLLIEKKSMLVNKFYSIAIKRHDFFDANNLNAKKFCKDLFIRLNNELKFCTNDSFKELLLEYKRRMENGLFKGFPKETTSEDTLRCNLAMFIKEETFLEPRTSSGQCDICIPSQKMVVETKLWRGIEYYNSGFPELNSYLKSLRYTEGYYIIYDYNKNDNPIVKENGEIFEISYDTKLIHIFFIRMNTVTPSQIYKDKKKNNNLD